jgi:hypothetical protein
MLTLLTYAAPLLSSTPGYRTHRNEKAGSGPGSVSIKRSRIRIRIKAVEAHIGAKEAHNGAVEAHNRAVEANPFATEGLYRSALQILNYFYENPESHDSGIRILIRNTMLQLQPYLARPQPTELRPTTPLLS